MPVRTAGLAPGVHGKMGFNLSAVLRVSLKHRWQVSPKGTSEQPRWKRTVLPRRMAINPGCNSVGFKSYRL